MRAQEETSAAGPKATPPLAPGEIHCWLIDLDRPADAATLAADERARAARMRHRRAQARFIAGRVRLRRILGGYVRIAPERLAFETNAEGRPALTGGEATFSFSRADGLGLLAVSRSRVLGADIESLAAGADLSLVAGALFSPAERSAIAACGADGFAEAFANAWTRKEAVAKALGGGFKVPFESFDVSLAPGAAARVLRAEGRAAPARNWTLKSFSPASGYRAAIACDNAAPRVRLFRDAGAAKGAEAA